MLLHPDYSQCAEDHAKSLILIHNASAKADSKIFDNIYSLIITNHESTLISCQSEKENQEAKMQSDDVTAQNSRSLKCRFLTSYSNDNNSWGEFQTHRLLLGLVTVAVYSNENDLKAVTKFYEQKKDEFNCSLLDSRIILIRKYDASNSGEATESNLGDLSTTESFSRDSMDIFEEAIELDLSNDEEEPFSEDSQNRLKQSMQDYLNNVFKMLDAKRRDFTIHGSDGITKIFSNSSSSVEETTAKSSSLSILLAPIEKMEHFNFESDKKSLQKRCLAREKKRLGDLYLQCGYPNDALSHYQTALESLKQVNDWLWVGGCLEGICTASVASASDCGYSNNLAVQLVNSDNIASPAFFRRTHNQSSSLRTTTSSGKNPDTPKLAASVYKREPNLSLDLATTRQKRPFHHDEIIKKYEEAMNNYKKFSGAAVVAVEAAMKACRLLMKHEKRLDAAKFLENVIFINLQATHKEEISLYYTLAELYSQLKFYRKSAFYKHYAVMRMMDTPAYNSVPQYDRTLNCMCDALSDAGVVVDPQHHWITRQKHLPAWLKLQSQLIIHLIVLVEKQGRNKHIINYSISLIDQWYLCLQKTEMGNYMTMIKSRVEDLLIASKLVKYEVNLNYLPIIRNVRTCQLSEDLQPHSTDQSGGNNFGVFIYTPLMMKEKKKESIIWVVNEECRIDFSLHNASHTSLHVAHLTVISRQIGEEGGGSAECSTDYLSGEASAFTLEPTSMMNLKLTVTPKFVGKLKLIGVRYQLVNLGEVWSTTYMTAPAAFEMEEESLEVSVIESLPAVDLTLDLPKPPESRVYNLFLLHGEYLEFHVSIKNRLATTVDSLSLTIQHTSNLWQANDFCQFNEDNLQSQLPLTKLKPACVTIYLNESHLKVATDAVHCSVIDSIKTTISLKYWNSLNPNFYRESKLTLITQISQGPRLLKEPYIDGRMELLLLVENPRNDLTQLRVIWKNSEVNNVVIEASSCRQVTLPSAEVRRCPPKVDRDANWLKQCLQIEWRYVDPFRRGVINLEDVKFLAYLIQFALFEKINIDLKLNSEAELSTLAMYRPLRLTSNCELAQLSQLDSISMEDLYLRLNIKSQDGRDIVSTCFAGCDSVRADSDSESVQLQTSLLFLSSGIYCVNASLNYILLDKTDIQLKASNYFEFSVPASL